MSCETIFRFEPDAGGNSRFARHYDCHWIFNITGFGHVACQRLCLSFALGASMFIANFEASGYWVIPSVAYSIFCVWMLCSCIYREDNRDDRISWAIMLLVIGVVAAPVYYWQRYRPLRAVRKKSEADDEQRLKDLLSDLKRRSST